MSDGDEAASFADVGDVADEKIAVGNGKLSSELDDFVAKVASNLILLIILSESSSSRLVDNLPVLNNAMSSTQHKSSLLVSVDNSCVED